MSRVLAVLALRGILPGVQSEVKSAAKLHYGHAGATPEDGPEFARDYIWDAGQRRDRFTQAFAALIDLDDAALDAELARWLIDGLTLDVGSPDAAAYSGVARLTGFDPSAGITPGAVELKALTRDQLIGVLSETGGSLDAEDLAKAKKGELVKLAADATARANWVPDFIRVPDPVDAGPVADAALPTP